jgi:hypothetical protein
MEEGWLGRTEVRAAEVEEEGWGTGGWEEDKPYPEGRLNIL